MNLMVYCQHVLGIGHLCRITLILQQMSEHKITLVLGGPPISIRLPDNVRTVQLPGLHMDEEFSGLLPVESGQDVEAIKDQRTQQLLNLFNDLQPDLLLVELFPFGRNAFRFELLPLLELVKKQQKCQVICSVRDILVERDNRIKFEHRVVDRINSYFHLLLIHGDPELICLDETFSRMGDIAIPVSYTGYICQPPNPGDRKRMRERLHLDDKDQLIVVSAGSGSVGTALLQAAVKAFPLLDPDHRIRMQIFTGPYMVDSDFKQLSASANNNICIKRFSDEFPAWLAAADLSISMGGYNTTMNLIASGCRALIYPFAQNHEQEMRAKQLEKRGHLQLLSDMDLHPAALAEKISYILTTTPESPTIMLDGAARTAEQLTRLTESG
jgi:predicted glycosyltransferase